MFDTIELLSFKINYIPDGSQYFSLSAAVGPCCAQVELVEPHLLALRPLLGTDTAGLRLLGLPVQ